MTREREPGTREDDREHQFGTGDPFSIGVEEELFLVNPATGRQANASTAVLERLGDVDGTVEPELHACQIELITGVHPNVGSAVDQLGTLRQAVVQTGAGVLGSGTYPTANEGDAETTDKERYERIRYLLGDAAVTPVGGLHIHVGMPDAETAIRAFNELRRDLPLLQALAANSPFRHGRDTGLASAREVTIRGWPRSGAPRAMRDYEDFLEISRLLARAADVPDYTWFWWKLRPHPRLGTVEIRALDAQASLPYMAALVALVHCLVRDAAEGDPGPDPPAGCSRKASSAPPLRGRGRATRPRRATAPGHRLLDDAIARAPGMPPSWGARASSRACRSCWRAVAAPGSSAPPTRSPGSTRSAAS